MRDRFGDLGVLVVYEEPGQACAAHGSVMTARTLLRNGE